MIYFNSDYLEGAHPYVMEKLNETNMVQTVGYGEDEYCEAARERIKAVCQAPEADVHFLVGGTQTNTTVIASILRPWQGVLSAVSGHINCHEAGAIESTGHKVITLPTANGKITARQVQDYVEWHKNDESTEHIVQPGMVYISHPTEGGTLYTKAELTALYDTCRRYGLPLFIDGARLGYGVMADGAELTIPDIARLCDVFYIGGTKVGALFGEAVVIMNPALKKDFRFMMKQRGGRMAKGRLLGIQFDALFTDDLYFKISATPTRWPIRFATSSCPPVIRCCLTLPPTSSTPLCRTMSWRSWGRTSAMNTGSGWTRPIPACASAPAGPLPRSTWTPCGRRYRLCGNKNRGSLLRKDMIYSCCLCPVDRINRGNISEIGTF